MSDSGGLRVVGSVALDHLRGPFGEVVHEPGGSAIYFALAASLIGPVTAVGPVGRADQDRFESLLRGRSIAARLEVVEGADTYRWHAQQAGPTNQEVAAQDSIYDRWRPQLAELAGWTFIGSMRIDRQLDVARALARHAGLLAADSMRSYITKRPREASELLHHCGWFFTNEEELHSLGGDPADPDAFRAQHQLLGLVLKRGPRGSCVVTAADRVELGAPAGPVVDVTGAGDSLAGGMLARWLQLGGEYGRDALAESLRYGVACASLAIEDIGVRSLVRATPETLAARLATIS